MSVPSALPARRSVPPPPPRRKHAEGSHQVSTPPVKTTAGISIADRIANLKLDNKINPIPRQVPKPPPPPKQIHTQSSSSPGRGSPPPVPPPSTRPSKEQIARALARRPPPPPIKSSTNAQVPRSEPDSDLTHSPPRRRIPPPPPRLPTPPPEAEPELESQVDHYTSPASAQESVGACIECYDFSFVDAHAAQFPRHTVTSLDRLAYDLTSPFDTETEKARAIFTWLHHNIAYDAVSFLSGNLKRQSPDDTLSCGLAVCDGYAGLFYYLAERSGLQVIKVSGYGKGYGYQALAQGQPTPPFNSNHAWNCVLMDGDWRLIDACWGAGYLCGSTYTQSFTPRFFTSSPLEFGKQHFPSDPSYQLLSEEDGGPVSWEDYILAPEGPCLYRDFYTTNLSPVHLQPCNKYINRGQPASFHLFKRCEHSSTAQEDNYVYFLYHDNAYIPLEPNAEGGWTAYIPIIRGSEVKLCSLQSLNGQDAKGVGVKQFTMSLGRSAMSWSGLAAWTVV
ncbi:hypothetical protein AX17_004591 [Amanita inopinata Kibby_2008]|nr:hypothetical protein AX17_004591 [Amanita inopinata Kibby_2008]